MAKRTSSRQRNNLSNSIERGDIYKVTLSPIKGREQDGFRPILVVSPTAFNKVTGVPIVAPITTGGSFARTAGFAVSLSGAGTETTGVVRCDQLRAIDLKGRQAQKIEQVPEYIIEDVMARIAAILEIDEQDDACDSD